MISAARANYQELAKLGQEHPQLVRLQVCASLFLPHLKPKEEENIMSLSQ